MNMKYVALGEIRGPFFSDDEMYHMGTYPAIPPH